MEMPTATAEGIHDNILDVAERITSLMSHPPTYLDLVEIKADLEESQKTLRYYLDQGDLLK